MIKDLAEHLNAREVIVRGSQRIRQQADRLKTAISPGWLDQAAFFSAIKLSMPEHSAVKNAVQQKNYSMALDNLLAIYMQRSTPRFYFNRTELPLLVDEISKQLPNAGKEAVLRGDMALAGRIRMLGVPAVNVGTHIHWQRDPVTGYDWPSCFWADIDYIRENADPKWVWELNRHSHWLDMARAFAYTGDTRYANAIDEQIESWIDQNPPGIGINWSSALETAHRLIAWPWVLYILIAMDALKPKTFFLILNGILAGARYIQGYLSTYSSPNTHLIGEAAGLFTAGILFPEFQESHRWRDSGSRILSEELARQVRKDGVHFEQSVHYHRYAVDFFLNSILLADMNKFPLLQGEREAINRMLQYLACLMHPDGSLPRIGDDDGGRVLFLGEEPVWDCRSTLSVGAVLMKDPSLKANIICPPEEAFWLLGIDGVREWESIAAEHGRKGSRAFVQSGFYLLQGSDESRIVFKCGPQGWGHAGHGHADALGIEWSCKGKPVLVDPGTFTYGGSQKWRSYFRSTTAHNTVRIDGNDQSEESGTFSWRQPVGAELIRRVSSRSWDLIEGKCEAYQRLHEPIQHHRAVLFMKDDYAVVLDILSGTGEHQIERRFQFAPGSVVLDPESLVLRWTSAGGIGASLVPVASGVTTGQILKGSENPPGGWFSPAYGIRVPAPMLILEDTVRCPHVAVALLVPSTVNMPLLVEMVKVERAGVQVPAVDALGLRIAWQEYTDYLLIGRTGPGAYSMGLLDTNGEMAFVRVDSRGDINRACLANGRSISWAGSPICQADIKLTSLTLDFSIGKLEVEAPGAVDLKICHRDLSFSELELPEPETAPEGHCVWLSLDSNR